MRERSLVRDQAFVRVGWCVFLLFLFLIWSWRGRRELGMGCDGPTGWIGDSQGWAGPGWAGGGVGVRAWRFVGAYEGRELGMEREVR